MPPGPGIDNQDKYSQNHKGSSPFQKTVLQQSIGCLQNSHVQNQLDPVERSWTFTRQPPCHLVNTQLCECTGTTSYPMQ